MPVMRVDSCYFCWCDFLWLIYNNSWVDMENSPLETLNVIEERSKEHLIQLLRRKLPICRCSRRRSWKSWRLFVHLCCLKVRLLSLPRSRREEMKRTSALLSLRTRIDVSATEFLTWQTISEKPSISNDRIHSNMSIIYHSKSNKSSNLNRSTAAFYLVMNG